jgi:hypothetical protein
MRISIYRVMFFDFALELATDSSPAKMSGSKRNSGVGSVRSLRIAVR